MEMMQTHIRYSYSHENSHAALQLMPRISLNQIIIHRRTALINYMHSEHKIKVSEEGPNIVIHNGKQDILLLPLTQKRMLFGSKQLIHT